MQTIQLATAVIFFVNRTEYWLGVCHGGSHLQRPTRAARSAKQAKITK